MRRALIDRVARLVGRRPTRLAPLSGGCIAEIYRLDFADGTRMVAKCAGAEGDLAIESGMLRYLAEHSTLPVPAVLALDGTGPAALLLLEYVETAGGLDDDAQRHAAELLAALHDVTRPIFGHVRDTLIGPLHQPNPESPSWLAFFRDHRLLHMAREALAAGRISPDLMARIERLAGRLGDWIEEPGRASLIHGDVWGGNVLVRDGRIAAFIDPAIYYADPEIELAFSTLFSTFGRPFFARYAEIRPLAPGFFEERRDLYNLYPLLVHTRLFGGGYASDVERIITRFGF